MSAPPPAPGWFPDPWQPGWVRWFDGYRWTPHATPAMPMAPGPTPPPYDPDKGASTTRWGARAIIGSGVIGACQLVAMAVFFGTFFRAALDAAETPATSTAEGPAFETGWWGGSFAALSLVGLLAYVCMGATMVWTYRACTNAKALGRKLDFDPTLSALSWIIPAVSLAIPYLSIRNVFPEGRPERRSVEIWWACHVGGSLVGFGGVFVSLASVPLGVAFAQLCGAVMVGGAVYGARACRAVEAEHRSVARELGLL